jgi:hypothetical protein
MQVFVFYLHGSSQGIDCFRPSEIFSDGLNFSFTKSGCRCGRAGCVTDQNTLAEFWNHPTPPDKELFHAYRMYHLNVTQINGNFYSKVFFPFGQ